MPAYEFEGITPVVDPTAFVHPTAVLIGDVIIGPGCLIGPGASLRGDIGRIIINKGSNLQDGCIAHSFPSKDVVVEENGHIGHGAILHGCTIKRNALVGMNAVIMDDAVIGEDSFVAALAFVKAGMQVPPRTLVGGIPAKIMRELKDDEIKWKSVGTGHYQHLAKRYLATSNQVQPLTEVEQDRRRVPELVYKPKHEQG
ncbi:MAG: phenylacetic acid degradation protein PaaY [Planctomycetes bacterium]|nr:phenylacetic acid degradation protein PaaY [Planctomycetota bacterium]